MREKKIKVDKLCVDCNKKISPTSTRCKSCANKGALNPFSGQTHNNKTRSIISKTNKGKWAGDKNPRVSNPLNRESNPNWKGGRSLAAVYPYSFKKIMRLKILQIYKCCQWCKKESDLVVHHIDHNIQNSDFVNLITLCRKCNIQEMYDLTQAKFYYFRTITENTFQRLYLHDCEMEVCNMFPGTNVEVYNTMKEKESNPIANKNKNWGIIKTR